jgi:Flp pilus assembly protein TadG
MAAKRVAAGSVARFAQNERGSIAMLFGLIVMAVMSITALGLDYGRILMARRTLSEAVDAASLAAGRAMMDGKLSKADVDDIALSYFNENAKWLSKVHAKVPTPVISTDVGASTITVTANTDVPMTFMAIAGFKKVNVPAIAKVAFDSKDLEVGMALDITGSMGGTPPGGGPRKIDGLKAAFKSFAETLIPDNPQIGRKIRIGVAPFSASVNLGKFAGKASNFRSGDNCVTERQTPTYTGSAPSNGNFFDVAADGVKDIDPTEGNVGQPLYFCPKQAIMPLTDDRNALIKQVNAYQEGGYTAGHIGAQWGWNLVSEDYAAFWGGSAAPAPYSDATGANPKLIKAVILMTDGIFNTSYHHDEAKKQALALCTAMKAKGIKVFTIGFGLGNTGSELVAKQTLQACATPGPQYFADASNTAQLDAALQSFATVLTQLRLSQ